MFEESKHDDMRGSQLPDQPEEPRLLVSGGRARGNRVQNPLPQRLDHLLSAGGLSHIRSVDHRVEQHIVIGQRVSLDASSLTTSTSSRSQLSLRLLNGASM
jgi:hypothetical protein